MFLKDSYICDLMYYGARTSPEFGPLSLSDIYVSNLIYFYLFDSWEKEQHKMKFKKVIDNFRLLPKFLDSNRNSADTRWTYMYANYERMIIYWSYHQPSKWILRVMAQKKLRNCRCRRNWNCECQFVMNSAFGAFNLI